MAIKHVLITFETIFHVIKTKMLSQGDGLDFILD